MNGLTLLTIATFVALAAATHAFYRDLVREQRRNARLRYRIEELIDVIEDDVLEITQLRHALSAQRHPVGTGRAQLTVIEGGA